MTGCAAAKTAGRTHDVDDRTLARVLYEALRAVYEHHELHSCTYPESPCIHDRVDDALHAGARLASEDERDDVFPDPDDVGASEYRVEVETGASAKVTTPPGLLER